MLHLAESLGFLGLTSFRVSGGVAVAVGGEPGVVRGRPWAPNPSGSGTGPSTSSTKKSIRNVRNPIVDVLAYL